MFCSVAETSFHGFESTAKMTTYRMKNEENSKYHDNVM